MVSSRFVSSVIVLCHASFVFAHPWPPISATSSAHRLFKRQALPLDQLFEVIVAGNGACSAAQISQMNNFVTESSQLVDAALTAIGNYATNGVAKRTLLTLFGITPNTGGSNAPGTVPQQPAQLQTIENWFTAVQTFLNTGQGPEPPSPEFRQPLMFCDSSWAQLRQRTDTALDGDGFPITDIDSDGDTYEVSIEEISDYTDNLRDFTRPDGTVVTQFPYLVNVDPNSGYEYIFQEDYNNPKGYCGMPVDAGTDTDVIPNIITLCPSAFSAYNPGLTSRTPAIGDNIATVMTRSTILFHELFHFTQGQTDSFDFANTWEDCLRYATGGTTNAKTAQASPECYTLFAQAMWLNQQYPTITFQAGTARAV